MSEQLPPIDSASAAAAALPRSRPRDPIREAADWDRSIRRWETGRDLAKRVAATEPIAEAAHEATVKRAEAERSRKAAKVVAKANAAIDAAVAAHRVAVDSAPSTLTPPASASSTTSKIARSLTAEETAALRRLSEAVRFTLRRGEHR